MVDYCTSADVTENLKGVTVSASTAVTTTALGNIIDQESATIDAYIQSAYVLPIVDTSALNFLKGICIKMCVYRVSNILQPKNSAPLPDENLKQDISHQSAYRDAMNILRAIMKGTMQLPIEGRKSIKYMSSTAVNENEVSEFSHSEKQW